MTKRNKELADSFKGKPCVVCGYPGEGDHIKNYAGNSGRDVESNMWSLYRTHHILKHQYGLSTFVSKFGLEPLIRRMGFTKCNYTNRWIKDD